MGKRDRNNSSTNIRAAARCRGGNKGWSELTEAGKMFGPAAITQEYSKKYSNGR